MTGLRPYPRDLGTLARAGDRWLTPPDVATLCRFLAARMLRDGAPRPRDARLEYARWKPGTSLTCAYVVSFADGERADVVLKRHGSTKAAAIATALAGHAPRGGSDARLCAAAAWENDVVWTLPADPQLPGLARALDLKRAKRWLDELELHPDARVRSHRSSARLLRYRPESRAVLKWDLSLKREDGTRLERTYAVRALPPERAARVARRRRVLGDLDVLPRLIAYEARTGLLLEEWLDVGPAAHDAFHHARAVGLLLGRLHGLPPRLPPRLPAFAESLQRSEDARAARRSLTPLFAWHPGLTQLVERLPGPPPPAPRRALRWTHGDVHPDQFAQGDGAALGVLLDLDRLALGDPCADLGSWIADDLAAAPERSFAEAARELLEGYALAGGPEIDPDALRAVTAEALVHRAGASLRRLEAEAEERARALLLRALECGARRSCAP